MLKIKLFRIGKNDEARYRIVVTEARSKITGEYTASLGWYNPANNTIKIDKDAYTNWLKKGAQPTPTVKSLVTKYS